MTTAAYTWLTGDHVCVPLDQPARQWVDLLGFVDLAARRAARVLVLTDRYTPAAMTGLLARRPALARAFDTGQATLLPSRASYRADGRYDQPRVTIP